MTKLPRIVSSLLVLISLAGEGVFAADQSAIKDGRFGFSAAGVTLVNSWPEVELSDGSEVGSFFVRPIGTPRISRGSRSTPAGAAEYESHSWVDARGYALTWTHTILRDRSGFTLQLSFENRSGRAVKLRNLWVLRGLDDTLTTRGRAEDWWLQGINPSRRNANLAQNLPSIAEITDTPDRVFVSTMRREMSGPRAQEGAWRVFHDFATLYTDLGNRGLTIGAVGPGESFAFIEARVNSGKVRLEIVSEMDGVMVDPSETRVSEEILFLAEPYKAAGECLFRWLAATHGARTSRGPIFGWCSWYDRAHTTDAQHVEAIAAAIQKNRDRFPMEVIQIDDGWQKAAGDWDVNRDRFPDGMGALAKKIQQAGAIPGIWFSPVRVEKLKHPSWGAGQGLDATHPEVQQFIRDMIRPRVEEGYRYFKFDFTQFLAQPKYNPKATRFQAMRQLFALYREAIGEDSYMLACVGMIMRPILGHADAARVATDAKPVWRNKLARDNWPGDIMNISDCIRSLGASALANGILHASDPDPSYTPLPQSKVTPKRFTLAEIRTWHSYVGLFGGLMMVSEPLNAPEFKAGSMAHLVEMLNPAAPERAYSLYGGVDPWHQHFGFYAPRAWGDFAAIAVYNRNDHRSTISVNTSAFPRLGKFHVWSFWDERYLGIREGSFELEEVEAHGPAVLRLTPSNESDSGPILIGSTLHIAVGSAEIRTITKTVACISVELTDAGSRDGNLFFFSKDRLRVVDVSGMSATLAEVERHIWRLLIRDRVRHESNIVHLAAN